MPNFNVATITKKGIELNAKVNFGRGTIVFTKAAAGAGIYDPDVDLMEATDLLDKRQEVPFNKKEISDKTTVHLRSIIDNSSLTEGYEVTEFGIYAEDPDEGEILYSITTADKPDYLPDASIGKVAITVESYVSVANAENVQIVVGAGVYASAEDLQALTDQVNLLIAEFNKKLAGLGKVRIGPIDTQLETGDTLFIIDGNLPEKFEAAAYSNVMFSVSSPEYADYWARMPPGEEPGQAAEGTANVPVTIGEIVVSQEAPEDAAFFAKITP